MKSLWIDKEIIKLLNKLATKICRKFGYAYKSIKRLHPNDNLFEACVGYCDKIGKDIRIEIRTVKGRLHSLDYLIDTLIHEIAHTEDDVEGPEHPADWEKRYIELKEWVNKEYGLFVPRKRVRR